jgi:hypothetical protein
MEKETEVKREGNQQEGQAGQSQGNQGQASQEGNQPILVELPDGTKVSVEELKAGFLKDADYRRKTAELAAERRRLQAERDAEQAATSRRSVANQYPERNDDEEPDPLKVLANEVIALKTAYARDFLNREIEKMSSKYPEADRRAVFDACWANPNASIEDEMDRSHTVIAKRIQERSTKTPASLDEFFKTNPKAKEEYDQKLLEEHMRKKSMKSQDSKTVTSGGSSSSAQSFSDKETPAKSYRDVSNKLKERFKEEDKDIL